MMTPEQFEQEWAESGKRLETQFRNDDIMKQLEEMQASSQAVNRRLFKQYIAEPLTGALGLHMPEGLARFVVPQTPEGAVGLGAGVATGGLSLAKQVGATALASGATALASAGDPIYAAKAGVQEGLAPVIGRGVTGAVNVGRGLVAGMKKQAQGTMDFKSILESLGREVSGLTGTVGKALKDFRHPGEAALALRSPHGPYGVQKALSEQFDQAVKGIEGVVSPQTKVAIKGITREELTAAEQGPMKFMSPEQQQQYLTHLGKRAEEKNPTLPEAFKLLKKTKEEARTLWRQRDRAVEAAAKQEEADAVENAIRTTIAAADRGGLATKAYNQAVRDYGRGLKLKDFVEDSPAFIRPSAKGDIVDSQALKAYLLEHGNKFTTDDFPELWKAALRGASPGVSDVSYRVPLPVLRGRSQGALSVGESFPALQYNRRVGQAGQPTRINPQALTLPALRLFEPQREED